MIQKISCLLGTLLLFGAINGCANPSLNESAVSPIENKFTQEALKGIAQSSMAVSASKEFSAIESGRIFSITPESAAPNTPYFASQAWTWNGKAGSVKSLLKFDLASIPYAAVITSAQLYLYHYPEIGHSSLTQSNISYLERTTTSWNSSSANWYGQPQTTAANNVLLQGSTSATQDYVVPVTGMVNDWGMSRRRNNESFGLMLKTASQSPYCRLYFASSLYPNPAYRPKLVISYYTIR